MTRVYQELLTVGRDANEMYLVPVPPSSSAGTSSSGEHVPARSHEQKACLLIGLQRGEKMMLNPVGGEAGPLAKATS